jgi:hypothetical protein
MQFYQSAVKVNVFTAFPTHAGDERWLRHYATNRQVAVSIPDVVIGIFE